MSWKLLVALIFVVGTGKIYADNEKALKYLKLCVKKPTSKYLFNHLYDAWNDDAISLEYELKKRIEKGNDAACEHLLVKLLEKEGRDIEALGLCKKLLRKNPDNPDLLLCKARLEFNEHDYEECIKDLKKILKHNKLPGKMKLEANKMLGRSWLRLDKEKEALTVWKQIYADNSEFELGEDILQLLLNEGLYEEANKFCQQLLKDNEDKFRQLKLNIKIAEILRLKGSRKKALAAYRKILIQTGAGSWLEKEIYSRIVRIYQTADDSDGLLKFTDEFLRENKARSAIRLRYIDLLFVAGKKDEAIKAYQELIKKAPLNKDYRTGYAKMLVRLGKFKQAAAVYGQLAKRFSKNSELLFSKAIVEVKANNKEAVLADIKAFLALNPTGEYPYIRAAKLLEKAKMDKEAGKFYRQFMQKFPDSNDALEAYALWLIRTNKTEDAVKLLSSGKSISLPVLLRRAKLLINYKKIESAYALLLRFAENNQKDFRFNENLFLCADALKKQKECMELIPQLVNSAKGWEELKRAVSSVSYVLNKNNAQKKYLQQLTALNKKGKLKPNNLCLMAVLQAQQNGDDHALTILNAAIKKYPRNAMLYRQKAMVLTAAGNYGAAAEVLQKLLRHESKFRALIYKKLVGMHQKENKQEEALKWAAKLKREFPDSVRSWIVYAGAQQLANKNDEAIKTLGRAAYRFPDNNELREQLVRAYSRKGDMRGAINICWKILRNSKKTAGKVEMIGRIYNLSNTEDLKDTLKSRLKLQMKNNPNDIFPLLALAEVERLSYRYNEYRDYVQKASQINKNSIYLLLKLAEIDEEQGNYAGAERTLKQLCKKDRSGKIRMKLAEFYFRSGEDEQGMEIYNSYLRDLKSTPELMKFATEMIVRKRPQDAVKVLKNKSALSENCELHYLLGCAYEESDKAKLAVQEFKRVIELSGKLNVSKKKNTNLNNLYRYRNPWQLKFPPPILMLTSIQQLAWQTYRHQQQAYSSYGRMGGYTLQMPSTEDEAKAMAICHLSKLKEKLSTSEQQQLITFIKAAGIKYPDVALIVGNRNMHQMNVNVKTLLKKYADDPDMKFFICLQFNQHLQRQLGRKKITDMMVELCKKRPQYSNMLIYFVLYRGGGENDKLITIMLNNIAKKPELSISDIQMLSMGLANRRIKLTKEQKKRIEKIIVDGLKKLRSKKQQVPVYTLSMIIGALLKNDSIAEAAELIKEEIKESQKNKNAFNIQYYPGYYYHGRGQGLVFNGKPFPLGTLNKLPNIINYIFQRRYGNDRNLLPNFFKACAGIKDLRIQLIAADGLKNKKDAAKNAAAIVADRKSSLASLALAAAWYDKEKQPEKACEILLKTRRLLKSKKERRELNCLLIAYALKLNEGDKEKIKKYVGDAAEKLLRLNLTVPEKVSLAKVMQLAGLDKQAAKIEDILLKKQRTSTGGTSTQIGHNVNLNAYKRIEQMFNKKNTKGAINLAQREYRRLFRTVYGVFGGGQVHNYYNIHQITSLMELIKRSNGKKDLLAKLKTTSSSPLIKQCEYAFACEQFGKIEEAEKEYHNILKKYPKNRFAAFSYGMMLIRNKYSANTPALKNIQLEDLIIVANNLYSFFKKPEPVLNFYDLLIAKMKAKKDFASQSFVSRMYLFNSLLNYFEGNRYFHSPQMQIPDVFSCIKQPEKVKSEAKKYVARRQELYLKLCEQMMRIPALAEMAFCRELKVCQLLNKNTDKFFDKGIKVIKLVNSGPVNSYFHSSSQYNLPDFDVWMFMTALRTKQISKLFEALKSSTNTENATEQIKKLNVLVECPPAEFESKAGAFIKQESDINKRADFQKMVIAVYEYRKLDCDLTDLMFKEIENPDNIMIHNPNFSAGIQAWLASLAKLKKVKMLCGALKKIAEHYAQKYKKEFPNELNVRNRFHQVFPYTITSMFRTAMTKIMQESPENWYQFYKALLPIIKIEMFAQQMNCDHNFYQVAERDPVKMLENSPFLGELKTIDFCPIPQYGSRMSSVYRLLVERSWRNNAKRKVKKYLKGIKKPSVGAKIFEAAVNNNPRQVFEILAKPENKFKQLAPARQKEILLQLKTAFGDNRIDNMRLKVNTPAWRIYQIYKKESIGNFQSRIKKFYKKDINYNRWNYMNIAAKLIMDVGAVDINKAVKIYEHMRRKVELEAIRNTYSSNMHAYYNFFNNLNNNCRSLKQCRVYYECLRKTRKPTVNMLNRFYSKLDSVLRQHYNKLNNKKNLVETAHLFLDEYEKAFAGSDFIVPYGSLKVLLRLNAKQFEQVIKERNPVIKPKGAVALKDKPGKSFPEKKIIKPVISTPRKKSKIRKQLDILVQAKLEFQKNNQVSKETVSKIWKPVEKLKPAWKVVLGLKIVAINNARQLVIELVDPAIKLALVGKRQIDDREICRIARLMVQLKDGADFKKAAHKMIRYYALEMCKWKKHDFKRNRTLTAYVMELAYRCGDLDLYNKIIGDFGFAEFSDSYIVMVNVGDTEKSKKYLSKNYLKFNDVPGIEISPEGKKFAGRICDGIKNSQKQYVVRVLFAAPNVFVEKNGKILYGKRTPQTKTLEKLAKDFSNIKFSNAGVKLFCLKVLLANGKSRDVLARNGKTILAGININTTLNAPQIDYTSRRAIGQLLFESMKYGAEKEVTSVIKTLNKIAAGDDRGIGDKAKNVLYRTGCKFAYPDLQTMTPQKVKVFCGVLLELMKNKSANRECAAAAAFLSYLAGDEKTFLAAIKKTPLNKNYNYYHKVKQLLNRFENYSRKNKINNVDSVEKMISFLDSESAKELFSKKKAELEKLKKYIRKPFEKILKPVTLNKTSNVKSNVKKKAK